MPAQSCCMDVVDPRGGESAAQLLANSRLRHTMAKRRWRCIQTVSRRQETPTGLGETVGLYESCEVRVGDERESMMFRDGRMMRH